MNRFDVTFSPEDKQYLIDLALFRIDCVLRDQPVIFPPPPPEGILYEKFGVFVTLKLSGRLRGCIGRLISEDSLFVTVGDMAEAAAFHDSRFQPLSLDEFPLLEVELSVLGPISRCFDPSQIIVGVHGLVVCRDNHQGLLLPQVPVEWEWDRQTFLEQACRKAALPPDAWRDPDTEIYWFEAVVM